MATFGKRPPPPSEAAASATPSAPPVQPSPDADPQLVAMREVLAERKKTDPMIHLKVAAEELKTFLLSRLKTERGVHIETALAVFGSLAGFACLLPSYRQFRAGTLRPDAQNFVVAETADGQTYFFGDLMNGPLLEQNFSVWSLVAGVAEHLGAKQVPDVIGIVKHVAATVGTDAFGIPRIPEGHSITERPVDFVRVIWPSVEAGLGRYIDDLKEFPIAIGLAIQSLMTTAKDVIDPALAALIVMECAVPMSKADPAHLIPA